MKDSSFTGGLKVIGYGLIFALIEVVLHFLFRFNVNMIHISNSLMLKLSIIFFISGILYAWGYKLLSSDIACMDSLSKGLKFGLMVFICAWVPNIASLFVITASESTNLLGGSRLGVYLLLLCHGLSVIITGLMLPLIFKQRHYMFSSHSRYSTHSRMKIILPMLVGALIFPAILLLSSVARLAGLFMDVNSFYAQLPNMLWMKIFFYGIFAVTGLILPLFYNYAEGKAYGSWLGKGLKFLFVFFLFFWIPVINIVIVFGWDTSNGLIFMLETLIPIIIEVLFTAYMIQD